MVSRLGPLEVNQFTKEPFLRLRAHPNIIITPPRQSDAPHLIPPMNDSSVHLWLGTPYPYTADHAQIWINKITAQCDLALKELAEALGNHTPAVLTYSPIRFLREVQEDGSDIFVGDIGLFRCPSMDRLSTPKHDDAINQTLPPGHPDIVWTLGDFLIPTYQKRGIMTDAVDTVINDIGKPLLGVRHLTAMVFDGNEGSNKVFLRNKFILTRCIVNHTEVKGFMRDLLVFERTDSTEATI